MTTFAGNKRQAFYVTALLKREEKNFLNKYARGKNNIYIHSNFAFNKLE